MARRFTVRQAELSDIEQIGIIGPAIYAASYGMMWGDAEAYARQLESFGAAAMHRFIARDDTQVWVAEYGELIVGFLTLVIGSPDPIEGRIGGAEVPRIYLLSPAQGHGLAKEMMAKAEAYARSEGMKYLWLDAMLEAPWAWKAYEKSGFVRIGFKRFGKGVIPAYDQMVVLRREIA
jgi:GNAT superfamily N-acetyltransferase